MLIQPVLAKDLSGMYAPAAALGGNSATLSNLINPLITNTFILSGLFAFFVILFAGFKYITGAGDKNTLTTATNMLNYGILGLVTVAAAFLITNIVGTLLGFKFF